MANDDVLVKFVVDEPESETQIYEFEQETVKIGRGRPGKARKGVDLQLIDATVARVAAVVQVRKETDVSIMDMGSGDTRIDGKKVGARGKLSSGTEILIGNTKIVIYIGEEARQFSLASDASEMATPPDAMPAVQETEGLEFVDADDISILDSPTGEHQTIPEPAGQPTASDRIVPPPLPSAMSASQAATSKHQTQQAPTSAADSIQPVGDFGAQGWDTPVIPEGFQFAPMHQTPSMTFGSVGPVPAPLPETFSGPDIAMLLDVSDRLGKEIWFTQAPLW